MNKNFKGLQAHEVFTLIIEDLQTIYNNSNQTSQEGCRLAHQAITDYANSLTSTLEAIREQKTTLHSHDTINRFNEWNSTYNGIKHIIGAYKENIINNYYQLEKDTH